MLLGTLIPPLPQEKGGKTYISLVPLSCGSYRVHTSLSIYVSGFRSPQPPLKKGDH